MQDQINQVRDFHERMQISKTQQLPSRPLNGAECAYCLLVIKDVANRFEPMGAYDERFNRLHLIAEELAELGEALARGCDGTPEDRLNYETAVLDALADLTYVVFGSAVAFDLPLANGFSEVHASNMTKEKQPTDPSAHRVRAKGPNYRPPNLKEIIRLHRMQ